jgi:hypothetical protein
VTNWLNWFKHKRQLGDATYTRIKLLSERGNALAKRNEYIAALQSYWAAWDLLPEPKTAWGAATWILAAIGDANFLSGDFAAGRENLTMAMGCPEAVGNPFLHLRLGQCHFELNELDQATDELLRAYMGGGKDLFSADDPRYFEFLTSRVKAPPGGW